MPPMEYSRHTLPSSIESHDISLENSNIRIRRPLSSSAGNAQLYTLASGNNHRDKEELPRYDEDGHMYPLMTVPSQPSQPSRASAGFTLHQRKQHLRNQREQKQMKQIRNPIIDSPQYQAYRERATREGNPDDQKWPDVLEDAFLDALLIMPVMGRRKFSYRGKPHGRNELIAEYLWIYYLQSLGPGEVPDTSMRRLRKQVSSHIQVIKGFLKTHPDVHKLFPKSPKPENGFQDSFKNDPCLRAISEGRLPSKRYSRFNNHPQYIEDFKSPPVRTLQHGTIRPCTFWLLITSQELPDDQSAGSELDDLYRANMVAHRFSNLSSEVSHGTLDSIPDWQHKFPKMAHLWFMGDLNCDIIHMDVALELMGDYPGKGAELCCRTEVTIPGTTPVGCEWMLKTTFTKPTELCRNGIPEPSSEETFMSEMSNNDTESRFKLPFPAGSWAVAITKLIDMQNDQKLHHTRSFNDPPAKSARKCIEEVSMYQEILFSTNLPSSSHRPALVRKAIILWTFQKTRGAEAGHTTWRYIDATKARRTIMSPSPPTSATYHQDSSMMYGDFNASFDESGPLHLQHASMLSDPFSQGLATPPLTGGLRSPFNTQAHNPYAYNHTFPFVDLPPENSSFVSSKTGDSESTLVEEAQHAAEIDHYLSSSNNIYGHHKNWQVPVTTVGENFDTDPTWGGYEAPGSRVDWEQRTPSLPAAQLSKPHQWQDLPSRHRHQHPQQKTLSWIDETATTTAPNPLEKQDWLVEHHQGTAPQHTSSELHGRREAENFHQPQRWMVGNNGEVGGSSSAGRTNETGSRKNSAVDVRDEEQRGVVGSILQLASSGTGGLVNGGGEKTGGGWMGNEGFNSGYNMGLTQRLE